MKKNSWPFHRFAVECVGTFMLSFAVLSAVVSTSMAVPLVAALTLAVLAYVLGPISGAHVNPAITVGLWSAKKLTLSEGVGYLVSQFIGGALAMLLLGAFINVSAPQLPPTLLSVIGEVLGTFAFAFGVTTVVNRHVDPAASGLVVGLSLFLGINIASLFSLGVLNPAIALALGIYQTPVPSDMVMNLLAYLLMPMVGAVIGTQAAMALHGKK